MKLRKAFELSPDVHDVPHTHTHTRTHTHTHAHTHAHKDALMCRLSASVACRHQRTGVYSMQVTPMLYL